MGVASMVIGIVSAVLSFIPFCGMFAFLPAIVGLVLGIVDTVLKHKKQQPKSLGIAGIALNGAALLVIFLWVMVIGASAAASASATP